MSHRRRGEDFSHLLESFCDESDCGSGLRTRQADFSFPQHSTVSETNDNHEKMLSSKNSHETDNSETCSYKSTILAGQAVDAESQGSTENSYRTACSGDAAASPTCVDVSANSCRSEIPSLMNRAIDVQFVPQSDLDLSPISGETRSSDELNRNIETLEKSSNDSRDTNYNIRNRVEVSTSSGSSYARRLAVNSPRPRRMGAASMVDDTGAKIFKRLSQEFISSPHRFTERLVTIIDESESGYDNGDNSGVELSRMTKEFRKMCKFIQDESMPEHMNSTLGMSRHNEDNNFFNIERPETIEESPNEVSSNDDLHTPEIKDTCRKIYRKTPLNLFKKTVKDNYEFGSPGSPNSTKNFVFLERYLNEQPASPLSECFRQNVRSTSPPDIVQRQKDKMELVRKSEQQLAALDESNSPEYETFDSHPAHGTQERENYEPRVDLNIHDSSIEDGPINEDELSMSLRLELEKKRERCFETARQMQKIEEDAKQAGNEIDPNVFERYGIDPEAECRKTLNSLLAYQDCWTKIHHMNNIKKNDASSLDSGIDTRSISRTLQSSSKKSFNNERLLKKSGKNHRNYESSMKNSKSTSITPLSSNVPRSRLQVEAKNNQHNVLTPGNALSKKLFTNTRKSPGKLCPTTKASRSRSAEKSSQVRPVQSTTAKSSVSRHLLQPPKFSPCAAQRTTDRASKMADHGRTASPASDKTAKSPRNRFFITPGKTVPVKGTKRRSKTFFPSMDADMQQGAQRIMKSLHAPGIYRKGFNSTVISPVSMYIRGTDMNLIQNVRSRQNEMLLTPIKGPSSEEKLKFKLAPNTPRDSPRKKCLFTHEKDEESQSDDNDENKQEPDFVLPKAKYELPTRIHTINESPKIVGGARTRGLLQSMQNRVVIRHERRIFGKHDEHDVPESGVDSVDMSIHVQRSAEKTSYTNRWN